MEPERAVSARRRVSKQKTSSKSGYRAFGAIDLGSNNCRLLIARPARRTGFRVVEAFSRIVRLGEGVSRTGRLSEAAMRRTIEALSICAEKLKRRRVTHLRAVATEACRRADNGADFVCRVAEETGIELEIISNGEEVRLAAGGCAPLLCPKVPNALIFDIGGGSTEISWLKKRNDGGLEVADWCSLPLGVVNLSEKFGGVDVSPKIYEAMKEEVRDAAITFERRHALSRFSEVGELQLLGTSGTVTTLAGVHLALARYQRARVDGYRLDFCTMRRISQRIATMSYDERVAEGCIGPERADLVIAGCAILEALCDLWPSPALMVADRGLREGILYLIAHDARHYSESSRSIVPGSQRANS